MSFLLNQNGRFCTYFFVDMSAYATVAPVGLGLVALAARARYCNIHTIVVLVPLFLFSYQDP